MGALEDEEIPAQDTKCYNDDIKQQLKLYREQKAMEEKANQIQSVDTNL